MAFQVAHSVALHLAFFQAIYLTIYLAAGSPRDPTLYHLKSPSICMINYVDVPQAPALPLFTPPPGARLGPWEPRGGEDTGGSRRAPGLCRLGRAGGPNFHPPGRAAGK